MNKEQHDFGMKYGHAPMASKVIAIDFDGTLVPWDAVNFIHTKALPGAVEAVRALKEAGYKIAIYTSRMSPSWHLASGERAEDQYMYVRNTLRRLDIPYDYITGEKIPCERYIDDRAIEFTGDNWDKIAERIISG